MSSEIAELELKDWRFEVDYEKIAWMILDREGESMNSLGRRVMEEARSIVEVIEQESAKGDIIGVVLMSGKDGNFVAGADIKEFPEDPDEDEIRAACKEGNDLLNRLENIRVPVVAAIDGFCLGGGLELALACHYRIATRNDSTRLGFPEVMLGILPGLNGSVRSIRQAGAIDAMQLMLTGRMLRSSAAKRMNLVDKLVNTHHELRWAARKAVLKKAKSKKASFIQRLVSWGPARSYLANKMRQEVGKKAREEHYPAPYKIIKLFEDFGGSDTRMAAAETRTFASLISGETSKNLRRTFKLMEMLKGQAPKKGFKPLRVHVIGAGTMGADIAAVCVASGMEVSLQDLSEDAINKGIKNSGKLFKKKMKTPNSLKAAHARFIADPEGKHIGRADLIIEAIVENLEIKQNLFKDLETKAKPDAVLATNTSSLPIEDIASPMQDPSRLVGIHFFNPVPQLPLVEVIKSPQTRESEVEKATGFVTTIGKYPLIVKSCPGFVVNRALGPYMFAAMERFEAGVMREKIDEAMLHFGMPMGPLELCDVVGLDICVKVTETLGMGISMESEAAKNSELGRLYAAGKIGKKAGEGFYVWENGKPKKNQVSFPKEELEALAAELVKPLLNECAKIVEEGIVESADHVDAGMIFGTGFAPFRGGPLNYMGELGETKAKDKTADAA